MSQIFFEKKNKRKEKDFSAFEYHLPNLEMFFFLGSNTSKENRKQIKQITKTGKLW